MDGVLLLDKPSGVSSNAALQRARRLFAAEKAGHTGTLDPLASGLLPVCFGEATKFAQSLLDADKRYRATVRFGVATTTGDAEGEVVDRGPVDFDRAALEAALAGFVGRIRQVPPRHSALKHQGKPMYAYARAGIDVPREPREVEIRALSLVDWGPPDAIVDVTCSKGTYVRTLLHDLGEAVGCGGHLVRLVRTRQGGFDLASALAWDDLAGPDAPARIEAAALTPEAALEFLPPWPVPASAPPLRAGGLLPLPGAPGEEGLRRLVVAGGGVGGIGKIGPDGLRVLHLFPPSAAFGRRGGSRP